MSSTVAYRYPARSAGRTLMIREVPSQMSMETATVVEQAGTEPVASQGVRTSSVKGTKRLMAQTVIDSLPLRTGV